MGGTVLSARPVATGAEPLPVWTGEPCAVGLDPQGLSPWAPDAVEGTEIHIAIENHSLSWASRAGHCTAVELRIEGASKQDRDRRTILRNWDYIVPPDDEIPAGYADMVDLTTRQVYEIKPVASWPAGWAEVRWYWWHLARQSGQAWFLGKEYLAEYGRNGTYIAPWPGYPDYEVWAALSSEQVEGIPVQGVVVYWARERPRYSELERVLVMTAVTALVAYLMYREECMRVPERVGGYLPEPLPLPFPMTPPILPIIPLPLY